MNLMMFLELNGIGVYRSMSCWSSKHMPNLEFDVKLFFLAINIFCSW